MPTDPTGESVEQLRAELVEIRQAADEAPDVPHESLLVGLRRMAEICDHVGEVDAENVRWENRAGRLRAERDQARAEVARLEQRWEVTRGHLLDAEATAGQAREERDAAEHFAHSIRDLLRVEDEIGWTDQVLARLAGVRSTARCSCVVPGSGVDAGELDPVCAVHGSSPEPVQPCRRCGSAACAEDAADDWYRGGTDV